jgi:glycosyltransferase involved in cell wall biosynthesis
LRLDESVTFAGALFDSQKESALAAAELFVLPSRSEGQSVALLEAMAAGLPVVVTPPANYPDVEIAEAGLVSRLDPASLAAAIGALLSDSDRAAKMGLAGQYLVRQHFTWPTVAAAVYAMYQAAMVQPTTA